MLRLLRAGIERRDDIPDVVLRHIGHELSLSRHVPTNCLDKTYC
jgi:hypothetical protein